MLPPYLWQHQALRFESECFMMVICLHSGYLEKLLRRTSTSPSSSSWTPWRSAWLGWVLPSEPPAAFNNTSHLKSLCCFVHRDANPLLMYLSSIAHAVLTSGRVFCEPGLHLQAFGGSRSTGGGRSQLPVWVFVISLRSDGSQIPFFGFRRGNTGFRLTRAQNVGRLYFLHLVSKSQKVIRHARVALFLTAVCVGSLTQCVQKHIKLM